MDAHGFFESVADALMDAMLVLHPTGLSGPKSEPQLWKAMQAADHTSESVGQANTFLSTILLNVGFYTGVQHVRRAHQTLCDMRALMFMGPQSDWCLPSVVAALELSNVPYGRDWLVAYVRGLLWSRGGIDVDVTDERLWAGQGISFDDVVDRVNEAAVVSRRSSDTVFQRLVVQAHPEDSGFDSVVEFYNVTGDMTHSCRRQVVTTVRKQHDDNFKVRGHHVGALLQVIMTAFVAARVYEASVVSMKLFPGGSRMSADAQAFHYDETFTSNLFGARIMPRLSEFMVACTLLPTSPRPNRWIFGSGLCHRVSCALVPLYVNISTSTSTRIHSNRVDQLPVCTIVVHDNRVYRLSNI